MLNKMTKEELETLSYTDLAEMILKESKNSLNTPTIFKRICDFLELTDLEYTNQIGDFYTSLMTDKRFVLLDNACWDLRDNHKIDIVLYDDEDEDTDVFDETDALENDENEQVEDSDEIDKIDDVDDDSLEDLTILDEEDLD